LNTYYHEGYEEKGKGKSPPKREKQRIPTQLGRKRGKDITPFQPPERREEEISRKGEEKGSVGIREKRKRKSLPRPHIYKEKENACKLQT